MSASAEHQIFCESIDLDSKRIPKHVAIIMDGNGRWAKERGSTPFDCLWKLPCEPVFDI